MYAGSVTVITRNIYACNTLCVLRVLVDASGVFSVQNFM
jgi:hypothetical protein